MVIVIATSSDQSSDTSIPSPMLDKATYRNLTHLDPSLSAALPPLNREEYEKAFKSDSPNFYGSNTPRFGRSRA